MYRLSFLIDNKLYLPCFAVMCLLYHWVRERPWLRAGRFDRQFTQRMNVCVVHKQIFSASDLDECVFACMYKLQTSEKKRIVNMYLSISSGWIIWH